MSREHLKHGVIDQVKYRKISSKIKWTDREYHVQNNYDVAYKEVKMYFDTNQFPALPFCGPHPNPHDSRGLSKHYNSCFDPKLGHGICAIFRIPCACVACTSMLDKPCTSGIPSNKQARYQPVTDCTYWPVLGSYNNFNIIHLTLKSTSFEEFEKIHQVILDGISDNMASLVQSCKYGTINTSYTTTNGFYVIKFILEAYTLQKNTTIDG